MMFRWTIKQPGIQKFEIHGISIKISMIEYHHWINDLVDHFILTQQSMGRNEHGISGHVHIFAFSLRNRFNLISEERVKFYEQNSENLMKIGWKIRKLWHFEVSQIFTKHFLTSRYEYANERVDDVIASLLAIYFVHEILKNSIFCAYLW